MKVTTRFCAWRWVDGDDSRIHRIGVEHYGGMDHPDLMSSQLYLEPWANMFMKNGNEVILLFEVRHVPRVDPDLFAAGFLYEGKTWLAFFKRFPAVYSDYPEEYIWGGLHPCEPGWCDSA